MSQETAISKEQSTFKKVPTTIITGFLGSGKTTAILNLLQSKPEQESWAVLVNEFGEIGIDGAILSEQGALVKEIPGGCMCCTAGVPMSVGINALLRTKPDRLLIEPTGLGHPQEVIAKLTSAQFSKYIDLKASLALIDPRHLSNSKYTEHPIFNQQLQSSQVIVANKIDLATSSDLACLKSCFEKMKSNQQVLDLSNKILLQVTQGRFDLKWLDVEREPKTQSADPVSTHHHEHAELEPQFQLNPGDVFVRKENKGQGFYSCGWLFGAEITFDFDQLFSMLSALTAERVKAVVNTNQGCFVFNVNLGVVSVNQMSLDGFESRFEVIDTQLMPWDQLETILLGIAGINES